LIRYKELKKGKSKYQILLEFFSSLAIVDCRKRGAGFFLPRVWGCPPDIKVPQDWGIKGVDEG
jgi:hypothetical protein